MREFETINDYAAQVGKEIGVSDWVLVDQDRINKFADATGDHQWIHVDPEKAKAGPFGGTIAHGYLTLSLIPMLSWGVYTVEGLTMGVNYGSDKVRFPTPVPVGSRIRGGFELVSLDEIPLGRQARTKVTIEIEGQDKPACVAEVLSVLVP